MDIKKLLLAGVLFGATGVNAQAPQSFQEFRQGLLNDFQEFRTTIIDHYADFLNGTWHEYESLMPLEKETAPKPVKAPNVTDSKPSAKPVRLPDPAVADEPAPDVKPQQPAEPAPRPKSPFDKPKTVTPPEAKDVVPANAKIKVDTGKVPLLPSNPVLPVATTPAEDTPAEQPADDDALTDKDAVNFYGMEIRVPKVDFQIMQSLTRVADFARSWQLLDQQEVAGTAIEALKPQMEALGLNDYLSYEFLCAYMDSKYPEAPSAPKMSAVHYLLANMGYDTRIGLSTKTGDPLLLMPTQQLIYGKSYMTINGERYYVLAAPGVNVTGSPIATCDLPKGASKGKKFNLLINGLNLPVKEHHFNIEAGKLKLTGTVNANFMPVVYRYPQMEIADFAQSQLDPQLRANLVAQIKQQLGDTDKLTAANELLKFVQSGFEYATDNTFHGFEKPYFLEENLFYPLNDCEDRAIFYTYMLWNALGLENHLLYYPGHESASVALPDPIGGTSYEHNGKQYYISDPTFVGSHTGQCMPQYESAKPKIDLMLPQ